MWRRVDVTAEIKRWIGTVILFTGLILPAAGQQRVPIFEAFTDAEEVFPDTYFQLTFTLQNAEGKDFKAPDLRDFRIIAGPSRGISTTVVNGQVSMEMRFSYTLQPRRTGRLTIGSASIQANNRPMRTNPITITVLEGRPAGSTPSGQTPDYFVKAEISAPEAYIGQQVRLDYKLYTTVEVQSYNMVEESAYLDFYAEDLMRTDPRVKRERVNGREYFTRVLKSMALYPQKAGNLTIQPASIQLGVVTDDSGPGSFFFGADIKRVGVVTEPLSIRVKALPAGAPPSFSGAVGTFDVYASVNRNAITTDDVLSLEITVTGDGDLKRIEAPALSGLDSFEVYEPRVKEEVYGEDQGKRVGRKVFEYLLTPVAPGNYTLQPAFSFFTPATGVYETIAAQTFDVQVRQGQQNGQNQTDKRKDDPFSQVQLLEARELAQSKRQWVKQPLFWSALLLPFVILGITLGVRYRNRTLGAGLQENRMQQRIRQMAVQQLKAAAEHLHQGQSRPFYEAISNALWRYPAERLKIPPAEQSREQILTKLKEKGIGASDLETFRKILQNCELALYGGMDNAAAMQQTYDDAQQMLEKMETVFQQGQ